MLKKIEFISTLFEVRHCRNPQKDTKNNHIEKFLLRLSKQGKTGEEF